MDRSGWPHEPGRKACDRAAWKDPDISLDGACTGVGDRGAGEHVEALRRAQDLRLGVVARNDPSEQRHSNGKREWSTTLREPPCPRPELLFRSVARTRTGAYGLPHFSSPVLLVRIRTH